MAAKARAPRPYANPVLGLPTRPLSPEEYQQLLRRFRAPSAGVLRLLAIVSGLGAVLLSVTYYLGTPYDPNSFPVIVVLAGLFAIGFAVGANAIIRDPRAALAKGEVLDMTAPLAALPSAPYGGAAFQLGSIALQVPPKLATNATAGQIQRIVLALGLRPSQRVESGVFRDRAFLLSANGVPLTPPCVVRYEPVPSGVPSAPTVGPMAAYPPPGVPPPPPPPVAPSLPQAAPSPPQLVPSPPPAVPSPAPAAPHSAPASPIPPPPGTKVFCDQCGAPNGPDFRFCRSCGASRSTP